MKILESDGAAASTGASLGGPAGVRGSKCDRCKFPSIIHLRYSGAHLCRSHFVSFVGERVSKEVKSQLSGPLALLKGDRERCEKGETVEATRAPNIIAVAVSGGKDSMLALHLLHSIFESDRRVEVAAVHVDEGIEGYRPETTPLVRDYCESRGIRLQIISFDSEFGMTLDQMVSRLENDEEAAGAALQPGAASLTNPGDGGRDPVALDSDVAMGSSACTYCGVFRRLCMNRAAVKLGARYLATGHNLDDCAQTALMNFMRADLDRLTRTAPHVRLQDGLVPRILPLRMIPEKESYLCSMLEKIPFKESKCPYYRAALRNEFRRTIFNHEERTPGTRHSIIRSFDAIRDAMMKNEEACDARASVCPGCGETSSGGVCRTCKLLDRIRKLQ